SESGARTCEEVRISSQMQYGRRVTVQRYGTASVCDCPLPDVSCVTIDVVKELRMRISRELEQTLTLAVNEAKRRRHEFLCLEHVLYALTFDEDVAKVIRNCGGDIKTLQRDLEKFFKEHMEALPPDVEEVEPQQTLGF